MFAELASFVYAHPHPGWDRWDGPGPGGPGWWLVFPILFWVAVASVVGYLIWRRSPSRTARYAAEQTLNERYARGEISEEELRQRRAVLRSSAGKK